MPGSDFKTFGKQDFSFTTTVPPSSDLERKLLKAAKDGNVKVVKSLVEQDADVAPFIAETMTLAARHGRTALLKYLLDEVDFDIAKYTLETAIDSGHLKIVKLLFTSQHFAYSKMIDSMTLLPLAIRSKNLDIAIYLIDINIKSRMTSGESLKRIEFILSNLKFEEKKLLIFHAATIGRFDIVKPLLSMCHQGENITLLPLKIIVIGAKPFVICLMITGMTLALVLFAPAAMATVSVTLLGLVKITTSVEIAKVIGASVIATTAAILTTPIVKSTCYYGCKKVVTSFFATRLPSDEFVSQSLETSDDALATPKSPATPR